ncbi:MAG: SulP family inorganic anion transporter, partial [Chloroflexota bacterium]
MSAYIPALAWLGNYDRQRHLGADLSAGVVIAVMLIPQSMAMALLAGLPPIVGLYSATIPPIIYAFFGSSRYLNVGPVAVVSLLTFAGVAPLANEGSQRFVELSVLLMLMVGVMKFTLGLLRGGFVVKF